MSRSTCTLFLAVAAFSITGFGQTYSLSVQRGSVRPCVPPGRCSHGTLTATAHDEVEMVIGEPFDIRGVEGPRYYQKSNAAIDGGSLTLWNRVQMFSVPNLIADPKTNVRSRGFAYAEVKLDDILTITGATGTGYFLPVYQVRGSFTGSEFPCLDAFVAICPGIPGTACRPRIWTAAAVVRRVEGASRSTDVDVLYQFEPADTLQFEFGVPFRYHVAFYSRILLQIRDRVTRLDSAVLDDVTVDSFRIELRGAVIRRPGGEPIRGVTVSSQSGISYAVQ